MTWRLKKVAQLLLEMGALEVYMCEVKPMSFIDVDPYCNAIFDVCLKTPRDTMSMGSTLRLV
jgi:hypothetical protein